MRKFYTSLLVGAIAIGSAITASAGNFSVGGLQFTTLSDSTVAVNKFQSGTNIVIPSTVVDPATADTEEEKAYDVVAINLYAFKDANIDSVFVPGSVKYVERYSFWKSKVKKVEFGEGVESIGYGTFSECENLAEVNIPESLKVLGAVSPVTGLGGSVFYGCGKLTKIDIPGSLDSIPNMNFRKCVSLKEVNLGEGLKKIGERVFEECSSLQEITFPSTIETIERGAFQSSSLTNPTFPGTVKELPNSCFLWCREMTSFTIEEGVEEIGRQAFADCRNFTEINIPNSVEFIHTDAFQANAAVKTIKIGKGLRRLGHSAFAVWEPDAATNTPHWSLTDIYVYSPVPPVYEPNDEHFDELTADFFFGGSEFTDELRTQFFETVTLHIPEYAQEEYAAADIWKEFKNVDLLKISGIADATTNNELRIEQNQVKSNGAIDIYAITGAQVAHTPDNTFDLSTLAKGIYIVRSNNANIKVSIN